MTPNPLQVLVDEMGALVCAVNNLVRQMQNQNTTTVVTVAPQKAVGGNSFEMDIGITAKLISPANTKRANISIQNNGSATIYLGFNNTVTVSGGSKPGRSVFSKAAFDNDTYQGDIWGIVVGPAVVTVSVWEEYLP